MRAWAGTTRRVGRYTAKEEGVHLIEWNVPQIVVIDLMAFVGLEDEAHATDSARAPGTPDAPTEANRGSRKSRRSACFPSIGG